MTTQQTFRFEISVWSLACVESIADKAHTDLEVTSAKVVGENGDENIAVEFQAEVETDE